MIRRLRLTLSAIAYAYGGIATAMALGTILAVPRSLLALAAGVWFAGTWTAVWGLTRGAPRIPAWVRRGVDIAAVVLMAWFLWRLSGTATAGEEWNWEHVVVILLAILTALRAVVITTPAECESFLASSLALSIWAATSLPWSTGAFVLAGFMWAWLTTMVLVHLLEDADRREAAGTPVAQTAEAWPILRTGVALSFLTVALGLGVFLVAVRPPEPGDGGDRGPASAGSSADSAAGALQFTPDMSFNAQNGPGASATVRFRIRAPRNVARFRLQTYDRYDAPGWHHTESAATELPEGRVVRVPIALVPGLPGAVDGAKVDAEVTVVDAGADALIAPGWLTDAEADFPGAVLAESDGGLRSRYPLPAGFRYRVTSYLPDWTRVPLAQAGVPGPVAAAALYHQVPPDLPAEVARVSGEWGRAETSPWLKVTTIAAALRALHPYQFEFAVAPAGREQVGWFLAEAAAGNCVNFATAMTLLARAAGVPARLATGCLAHTRDEAAGEWLIAAADFHAWCEVALDGIGWVPVDATPPAVWNGRIVGGTAGVDSPVPVPAPAAGAAAPAPAPVPEIAAPPLARAASLADRIKQTVFTRWPWVLLASVALWVVWSVWKVGRTAGVSARQWRRRRRLGVILQAFGAACDAAAVRGHPRRETQTALEFARTVRTWAPAAAAAMVRLAELATNAEFGPNAPDASTGKEARRLSRECQLAISKSG